MKKLMLILFLCSAVFVFGQTAVEVSDYIGNVWSGKCRNEEIYGRLIFPKYIFEGIDSDYMTQSEFQNSIQDSEVIITSKCNPSITIIGNGKKYNFEDVIDYKLISVDTIDQFLGYDNRNHVGRLGSFSIEYRLDFFGQRYITDNSGPGGYASKYTWIPYSGFHSKSYGFHEYNNDIIEYNQDVIDTSTIYDFIINNKLITKTDVPSIIIYGYDLRDFCFFENPDYNKSISFTAFTLQGISPTNNYIFMATDESQKSIIQAALQANKYINLTGTTIDIDLGDVTLPSDVTAYQPVLIDKVELNKQMQ